MCEEENLATDETFRFRRCRDFDGKLVPLELSLRGKRAVLRFPNSLTEAPCSEPRNHSHTKCKARILRGLDSRQQAIFLLIHEDGCSRSEAAERLGISRPTFYCAIAEMRKKSPYCWVSAALARKVNQHG